jgi:hypothetical protein
MELETHRVGGEGATGQPRPLDRVLAFLDVLLACAALVVAALVVEGDHALGGSRQVGDDEADARIRLARVPLDFRHHSAGLRPALRLIAEAGIVAAHLMRWPPNRA